MPFTSEIERHGFYFDTDGFDLVSVSDVEGKFRYTRMAYEASVPGLHVKLGDLEESIREEYRGWDQIYDEVYVETSGGDVYHLLSRWRREPEGKGWNFNWNLKAADGSQAGVLQDSTDVQLEVGRPLDVMIESDGNLAHLSTPPITRFVVINNAQGYPDDAPESRVVRQFRARREAPGAGTDSAPKHFMHGILMRLRYLAPLARRR